MAEKPKLVDADEPFERVWGIAQTAIVGMLAVMVIAGCTGLLGRGPLSHAEKSLPATGGQVTFERLARNNTPSQIVVAWDRGSGGPGAIVFDQPLVDAIRITSITPAPISTGSEGTAAAFNFATLPGKGRVVFSVQPARPGVFTGRLWVLGQTVNLSGFTFP